MEWKMSTKKLVALNLILQIRCLMHSRWSYRILPSRPRWELDLVLTLLCLTVSQVLMWMAQASWQNPFELLTLWILQWPHHLNHLHLSQEFLRLETFQLLHPFIVSIVSIWDGNLYRSPRLTLLNLSQVFALCISNSPYFEKFKLISIYF